MEPLPDGLPRFEAGDWVVHPSFGTCRVSRFTWHPYDKCFDYLLEIEVDGKADATWALEGCLSEAKHHAWDEEDI